MEGSLSRRAQRPKPGTRKARDDLRAAVRRIEILTVFEGHRLFPDEVDVPSETS